MMGKNIRQNKIRIKNQDKKRRKSGNMGKSVKKDDIKGQNMSDNRKGSENTENRSSEFLKKLIVILAVAIVVTCTVFFVIYYRFSYQADKLTKETARIYAFGDGEEMAGNIAPGYIEKYESKSKVLSVSDIQDIYIDKFRTYMSDKVGDIKQIECKVTDIQAVSNVEDLQQEFEDNGVKNVSQYRTVDADWIVTGKDGDDMTIHVREAVLKCDDGWFVDYVMLPDDITGNIDTTEAGENGAEITETTDGAETTEATEDTEITEVQ